MGHYPDDSCEELKDVISRTFNVGTDCISVGAGSSDIIRNVPNTFYGRGDKVVIPRPSFAEYTQQCRIVGADIRPFELEAEEDFRIDADRLLEAGRATSWSASPASWRSRGRSCSSTRRSWSWSPGTPI